MKVSIFTAAINGDNAGDAIIESAVVRLLKGEKFLRFPLTSPLNDDDIAAINTTDVAIICGTNLYQHVFACNLTIDIVRRIIVPIIPFGIGTSAPVGEVPRMNAEGAATVKAIHAKCVVSSVRDPASLRFLWSLGITNTVLTGCPVLFHGLRVPDFARTNGGGDITLTPRGRLLHIDQKWQARQRETLDFVARRYRPKLVLQSPYDIKLARPLVDKYGLDVLQDAEWRAEPYLEAAVRQSATVGFRLHFAMLSLSYGKLAHMIGHDSRISEFCALMRLPPLLIDSYSDNELALHIDGRSFAADAFRRRWGELSLAMVKFIKANGLETHLVPETVVPAASPRRCTPGKPRICLLVDRPGWAFDVSAKNIKRQLSDVFAFDIKYVVDRPRLDPADYDLLYVFFWGERYHLMAGFPPDRVIKEVSSHRWQDDPAFGPCSAVEFADLYLRDCSTVFCTSRRLAALVSPAFDRVFHTPNGIDVTRFSAGSNGPNGPLVFGWAGNAKDTVKGFHDIVVPACGDRFPLHAATGDLDHRRMAEFYRNIDVFVVASRHEGEPLTLIEAMASGCFPVCVDVGIVPELIEHGVTGYVVTERTPEAFIEAFVWCETNVEVVRMAAARNAERMKRERSWEICAQFFKRALLDALAFRDRPRFRNDDVSCDTNLENLKKFCAIFHKYGHTQIHCITLRGLTNALYETDGTPVEYDGYDTVARLDNATIRRLSEEYDIDGRYDLIDYINKIPDEIALHGLYHEDYSKMSLVEQCDAIEAGLQALHRLFPAKNVRYFVPPFNRTNNFTIEAARQHGLDVVAAEGVHLEAELGTVMIESGQWYRYHHHRFYPESKFSCYALSFDRLDQALARNFSSQPADFLARPRRPAPRRWQFAIDFLRGLAGTSMS